MIYFIGGRKNGTGRIMVALALLHILKRQKEIYPVIIDSYPIEPPELLHRISHNGPTIKSNMNYYNLPLEDLDGWIKLINIFSEFEKNTDFIVDTTGDNCLGLLSKSGFLDHPRFKDLNQDFITIWPLSPFYEGLELMENYLISYPDRTVFILNNAMFGFPERLMEFVHVKDRISRQGGAFLTMSYMPKSCLELITDKNILFDEAFNDNRVNFALGSVIGLENWLHENKTVFDAIIKVRLNQKLNSHSRILSLYSDDKTSEVANISDILAGRT